MAHLLGAEALHLEYPNTTVFDGITIGVHEGDRIGIVGRNGDGKSSLLGLLAGTVQPDDGRVTLRGGTRLGVLDQADNLDDSLTVAQTVVGDMPEYEWASDARVRDVIEGLLADLPWDGIVSSLSGGQRRRVSLARLLIGEYEILALDEPTNHLDMEAITWLAQHIKRRWPPNSGALLVVTHDRWFLDEVCTTTWEVHDRLVEPFEGGYAAYILQRVERDRQAASSEARRQNLARKELAWLRRGAPARTAKPKFRIEAANELIADVPEIRDKVALQSLAMARLGKTVVNLTEAGVSYGDHQVLQDVEWKLAPGERTGVLGVNGAGKSTLLGLIAGSIEPTEGRVRHGKTVKVRTLTQRMGELDEFMDEPVRVLISRLRASYVINTGSKSQELTPSQLLERLGFSSAQLSTPIKDLSGGQQRRLQLLLVLLDQPNVLILDEPTNDLDTDMLSAMEDLLDTWPGTLIVVSHDRYFLERVTDEQYAVMDSKLRHLPGGIDEYLKLRSQGLGAARVSKSHGEIGSDGEASPDKSSELPVGSDLESGSNPAAKVVPSLGGAERRNLEKEVSAIERRLKKVLAQVATTREEIASHDQSDYEGLAEKSGQVSKLELEIEQLEGRWLELHDLLG